MKHFFKLTIILVLFTPSYIQAQTLQTDYTLESSNVSFADQSLAIASTIAIQGSSLRWTQENNGTINITDFQITSTSGNWDQTSSTGVLTHTITIDDDYFGTFVLEGTTSGLSATLSFDVDGNEQHYIFFINSINYQ